MVSTSGRDKLFKFIKICLYIGVLFSSLNSWNETAAWKMTFYNFYTYGKYDFI